MGTMRPAILVIDMQKKWFASDKKVFPDKTTGIKNIRTLVAAFHERNYPVIYVKMEHKELTQKNRGSQAPDGRCVDLRAC